MTVIYRYRQERRYAKPPAAIWPLVSDTARAWELSGFAPYRFEERVDAKGRVRRFVRGKAGPFPVRWEEDFAEWQENRRFLQVREYRNGPMRRWEWGCELFAEGEGCRLVVTGMAETAGLLGFVGRRAGIFDAEFGKAMASIDRLVRDGEPSFAAPVFARMPSSNRKRFRIRDDPQRRRRGPGEAWRNADYCFRTAVKLALLFSDSFNFRIIRGL